MGGDLLRRNQNLYYTYHRNKGRTTEQCKMLKDHLEQLVNVGYLKKFVVDLRNQKAGQGTRPRGNALPPPVGVIEVIHVALRYTMVSKRRGILAVVLVEGCSGRQPPKKNLKYTREPIAFNDDDLEGTIQSHNDALVLRAQINGFIGKRVLID
ncbi:uncharacterized protein LOC115951904 [Quercus lobata]|uniref:uncharacterized protein LOC115951904 n=1 Tax=Quercus lobata TaxID=97700 RepID=UPI001247BCE5|nr:uncharacterized protein LOC115951904 [Quercus lobata]